MPAPRLARHHHVGEALRRLDDDALRELVAAGRPLGEGIGGPTRRVDVDGIAVFVKQLPLTDLERRPEHRGSTADLFDLPVSCHYGIGSPGFTAWREVAAAAAASDAVVAGRAAHFPLLHHWRVLPRPGAGASRLLPEPADVHATVRYWEGSDAVRRRLLELAGATATVTLFSEHLPGDLDHWLADRAREGDAALTAALDLVVPQLHGILDWLDRHGWVHMDAHFGNILTDGHGLFLTDFALALLPTFDLSPAERAFAADHASYDASYLLTHLATWLVRRLTGAPPEQQRRQLADAALGTRPAGMPAAAADLVVRYAPVAAVVRPFYHRLQAETRTAAYPARAVREVLGTPARERDSAVP
jgi:hypothetical protein